MTGWPVYHPSGNSLASHDPNDLCNDEGPSTPGALDDDDDEDDKDKVYKNFLDFTTTENQSFKIITRIP